MDKKQENTDCSAESCKEDLMSGLMAVLAEEETKADKQKEH